MIEVHESATASGVKVPIAPEEMELAYELKPVDVRRGEPRDEAFLSLNPNAKVPVLVDDLDSRRLVLTESAAILVHLAENTDKLLPQDTVGRAHVFEQLFFHASALTPAFTRAAAHRGSSVRDRSGADSRRPRQEPV